MLYGKRFRLRRRTSSKRIALRSGFSAINPVAFRTESMNFPPSPAQRSSYQSAASRISESTCRWVFSCGIGDFALQTAKIVCVHYLSRRWIGQDFIAPPPELVFFILGEIV